MGAERDLTALVACFGNVLRADDGFGNEVARRLESEPLPDGVRVVEIGIGGIHLIHELAPPPEVLVVVDAVDLGRPPGQVVVLRPEVLDVWTMTPETRRDQLADVHYATPERALMLANGLELLPAETWLVGCQVADVDDFGGALTPALEHAVESAIVEVKRILADAGIALA